MDKDLLDIYTDYLISQTKYATATKLSDILDQEVSHDKITRFLSKSDLTNLEFWKYIKPLVRKHNSQYDVLCLDDTISEKPSTDENDIVCWHHSHAKGVHVKGINIVSCMLSTSNLSIPIDYEIVKKDERYYDKKDKRYKRRSKVTKNQMFQNMINRAVINHVKFKYILADSWFCSKDNMNFIHHTLSKKFILGMKSNRVVALTDYARRSKDFIKLSDLDIADGESLKIWLKDMNFPVLLTKRIFINENGTKGILYLVTNDLEIDSDQLYHDYQKRWQIEVYHKSIKQNTSLSASPTKVEKTQRNHIFCSLVAFCKLEMLKIKTSLNHFALKYKLLVRSNDIALKQLYEIRNS